MSLLHVKNVSLNIHHTRVVDDISFSINSGEVMAIVGPNGAGKSSLIKVISGELRPSSGSVRLNGKDLSQWSLDELARERSVLPQLSLLNFPFTVHEVVALGRSPHSSGRTIDEDIIREQLLKLDMSEFANRSYPQLSGGEKQRTQLARTFAQIHSDTPSRCLLILDEPTSALDLGHQQQLLKLLRTQAKTGTGIVLVVHDLNIASKIADKILLMNNGKLVDFGEAESVLTEPQLSKTFRANMSVSVDQSTGRPVVSW
jgi:iron complex transport system ATP-binding protein